MPGASLSADVLQKAASGLVEVIVGFAEEVGHEPTLAELLEILGWALPLHSGATDGTFTEPLGFTVIMKEGQPCRDDGASRVAELNDHLFEVTRELSTSLVEQMHATSGTPVTPQQFASTILQVVQSGEIRLADVDGHDVQTITADVPQKRIARPRPGDVVAIPAKNGGYRLAVVLTRNHFGTALGLFEGISTSSRLDATVLRVPRRYPMYTEDSRVKDGTWKVVGHDDRLLASFPADPPIYHRPGVWPGIDTGEFGAAETADGSLRLIGPDEAREVGLSDGTYRQTITAPYLQKRLDAEDQSP